MSTMTRQLDTPLQMMIHLATEAQAENKENVQKTIFKMKSAEEFNDKVKALGGVKKVDLAQTYSFLLSTTVEDPRVAKLTQPGLQKMIARRCTQLMPQWCFPCEGKLFYSKRGEVPDVICRRCQRGACPSCFDHEAVMQLNKFRYLCKECDDIVNDGVGEERLLPSDLDKNYAKKNKEKNAKKAEVPEKSGNQGDVEVMHPPGQKVSSDSDSEDSVKEMIEDDDSEAEDELSILQRQKNKKLLELRKNEKKTRQKEENKEKSKKKESVCPHL